MNRLFISSDIEGTCGIAHWNETILEKPESAYFREQMTREVAAACNGAIESGADQIFIKDAHDTGRNINPARLPRCAEIFRSWGCDIFSMMSGLDASFSGVFLTGYHSSSNTDTNPLSHTMNTKNTSVLINGIQASELLINLFTASLFDVPVLMVTGDLGICEQAKKIIPSVYTVPVNRGCGDGAISIHPDEAVERIQQTAKDAFKEGLLHPEKFTVPLPNHFDVEVEYINHFIARRASFYPGVRQLSARRVLFTSDAYYDVLRFLMFCVSDIS